MTESSIIMAANTQEVRYLNISQASSFTGFSVGTLYQFIYERRVPYIKKGRAIRFDKNDLISWMEESRVEQLTN